MSLSGIYRHFKGNYYEVIGLAVDVDTNEEYILYRQMYDVFGYWMRPKSMFLGTKQIENGLVQRFVKVGISYENILAKENIYDIKIGNSETQEFYTAINEDHQNDDVVFFVKKTADQ